MVLSDLFRQRSLMAAGGDLVIIQGSNNPLVIQFDAIVDNIPVLVVTLWDDLPGICSSPIKTWRLEDMTVSGKTAVCPITEEETGRLSKNRLVLEAKGLDEAGNTIFWDDFPINVKPRRDRTIKLTQMGG